MRDAYAQYGAQGPLTSGVEQTHWPDELKDRLRANAREIGQAVADAMTLWHKAGKRQHTFRREAQKYHVDGSRY